MSRVDDIINGVRKSGTEKKKSRVETIIENSANGSVNFGVDQKYIDTFVKDATDFLTTADKDYGSVGWSNASSSYDSRNSTWVDLNSRADTITAWLNNNRNSMDKEEYDSYIKMLDSIRRDGSSVVRSYKNLRDETSQFESEEDYNNYKIGWLNPDAEVNSESASARKERYQSNADRIAEIESELDEIGQVGWVDYFSDKGKKVKALNEEKQALEAENTKYKHIHEAEDSHFIPITDEVKQTASKRDYTVSAEEVDAVDAEFREIRKYLGDGNHRIEDNGNIVNSITGDVVYSANEYSNAILNNDSKGYINTVVQDKLGLFLSTSEDDLADAYGRLQTHSEDTETWASILKEGDINGWKQLTEDEITIYYYKLNTEGQEAAYKFLEDMTTELTRRETQKRAEEISDATLLKQIAYNVASIPMNIIGGAVAFTEDVTNIMMGEDINPYSRAHSWQNDASVIRADTAQDIDNATGNASIPWLDFSLGDAYQAGMSGLDSLAGATFLGGTGYGVLMGMGAASSEMKELYESGASTEQMLAGGILAGAAEMVFEKFSIDQFVKMGDAKSIKDVVINILKQGGVEASEEAFTEIANTITNAIVMGSQSDWEDMGTFVKNVVNAGLGGFISGGGMGGIGSVASYAQYAQERTAQGQEIIENGGADYLKELALEMAGANQNKEGQKIANLVGKVEQKSSAKNVGKLYAQIGDTIVKQNRADIQKALVEKGLTEKEAKRVSAYLGSTETFTDEQIAEIEGNESIKAVVTELLNNSKSDISERSRNLIAVSLGKDYKNATVKASKSGELSLRNDVDVTKKISETGKAIVTKVDEKGKEVTTDITIDKNNPIAKVKYVGDERVVYLNTDHGTVEASKVKYASKDEALLYEAFVDMNPAFANAVIKNYDGSVPIQTYIHGMREGMILYGMHNFQGVGKDISRGSFLADLSEADQAFALKLGRAYAKADAKKADKDLRSAIKNATEKAKASEGASTTEAMQNKAKKGKVSFEEGAKAGKQHKKVVALAKHLARAMGIDIVFYDSRTTTDPNGKGANGYYDEKTDTIHLDLQKSTNDAKTIAFTLSHELVHFIKKWSPEKYNKFAEFLMEQYASHGVSASTLLKQKMAELGTKDADLAYEEMIADACETMLLDSNAVVKLMELRKSDLELFEKIKLHILKILNDIREAYKSLGYQPTSDEAKALLGMKDVLEQFYSLFEEAAVDATKTYQATNRLDRNSASDSKIKKQVKRIVGESGTEYGIGVYLDSTLLTNLTDDERIQMVKEYVKELGGSDFIAYDTNYNMVSVHIAESSQRFKNKSGKKVPVNKDLTNKNIKFPTKQESIALVDELILTAKYDSNRPATYSHGWVDNYGNSNWEYWVTYVQDKENTIWEATLNIATSANGEKILYDIDPIKMVEQSISLDTSTTIDVEEVEEIDTTSTDNKIAQDEPIVKNNLEISQKNSKTHQQKKRNPSDKDYIDAVNRGDTETAQRMVDEVAREAGYTVKAYHGTSRADRVGTVFRPDRATSGPMAFFTDNKDIAGNYAKNKADTSLAYDTEYDSYYTQFRVNRNGKNVSIPELWNYLSYSEKNSIKEKAKHIKFDDDYETIIVDPTAQHGNGAWDSYTLNMHKGNALEALVDTWLETGDLFNQEAEFLKVLELVGISDVEYRNPDARYEKTYDTWLKIQKPFDTDNVNQSFYDRLSKWIENHDMSVYEKETSNADMWDKNNQTPESWLDKLSHDIEEGTTHAWTVIPDFVTDYLKEQGYDGIKDKGGKGGGAGHTVWIPFSSEQVKSAEPITYDDNGNVIPLSERFNSKNKDIRYQKKRTPSSYAPTFYSQMGKVIDDIKMDKIGANSLVNYLKGKGIKHDEIKWSGIEAFLEGKKSVTKAELQEFLAGSQLIIEEEMSSEENWNIVREGDSYIVKDRNGKILETWEPTQDPSDPDLVGWISLAGGDIASTIEEIREYTSDWYGDGGSRWSEYRLDGGTNYRELVFKMPNSSYTNEAMKAHWGQDAEGVLAHARIQDMTTSDGKKMLFIEEIQSDWHNEGQKKGYAAKLSPNEEKRVSDLYDKQTGLFERLGETAREMLALNDKFYKREISEEDYIPQHQKVTKLLNELQAEENSVRKERMALEGNADGVPDAPFRSNYHEYVLKRLLRMATEEGYDSIGWTTADIQSKRWSEDYAEGYRIEYDQDIPKFLKKYGKKWGATVSTSSLNNKSDNVTYVDSNGKEYKAIREWYEDVMDDYIVKDESIWRAYIMGQVKVIQDGDTMRIKLKWTGEILDETLTINHAPDSVWSMDITEPMEQSILYEGQPKFQKKRNSTATFKGKPFWSGSVSLLDGVIEEVHTIDEAETADFHHSMYFSQAQVEKMESGENAFFWIDNGKIYGNWRDSVPQSIIERIEEQVVISEDDHNIHYQKKKLSNRTILANTLESAVDTSTQEGQNELRWLKDYQSKIALIEKEEAHLAEVNAEIKEISFAKGSDRSKLKALNDDKTRTANRIYTYDRQLLRLEAMKPIKEVLAREKELVRKRTEEKGREALNAYREKMTKTQRELLTRYQESRTKGVEGRRKTEMRHKIKAVVNELNQYLTKGTKDKHVPIELQKPVAEALIAVNMDTVGAEERIAKKQAEMRVAKSLEEMQRLSKEIEHIQEMGGNMEAKLSRLKTAYDSIINSDDPLIANSHDEVISNTIARAMEVVGDTPLKDMSLYQLVAVYDMYKMVLTSVRNANKAFKAAKNEEISTIANGVIAELMDKKRKSPYSAKGMQALSEFDWNNLKPVFAFERIGSANFTKVFKAVRAGEDTWAWDMSEAQAFREEQFKKYKYDSWDFKKRYGFTSTSGMHFELSLDQIMSLYAFSKREQAGDHLKYGGFVFDGLTEVKVKNKVGVTVTYQLKDATAYNLSEETIADIIDKLTPEQRAFADTMQDYLSTVMGEKGNEVSLALYDVKLFKEKHYFPLKSAPQYMAKAKEQAQGEVKIKNSGFTKETTPKAKNPIVLSSFMDVWAGHVNEMSMYHAFTLPLEDFYRVYNYHTSADEKMEMVSVGASLENAHGQAVVKYIDQLLKDLNGGARSDPRETLGKAMMSNFKKAAVMASLSVVVQQPSAIVRATALVDAKYFAGKPIKGKHKEKWAEVKKYAPVAVIKEMGYFDTGMGKGSVEWLKGEKTFMDKVDDVVTKAPALADELTWVAIWEAVKRETVHTHNHLRPNSEEFLKAVGERFTEVIVKTQVYDSTLSRSANMRSKSGMMNMWTAFMAEPTTSINMLQDAFRKGNKKYIARTLGAVYGSVILNAALVSLIYAMRDDDDDETFLEKYLSRFTTEVIDGINPLTYIPFFKDIWSAAQGFDIERADMSLITSVLDSLQQMIKVSTKDTSNMDEDEVAEHKKAVTEALLGVVDNLASLVGVPVKNVRRDINGIINTFNTIKADTDGRKTTVGSLVDNIGEDVKDSIPVWGWLPDESKGDKLYDAIIKGDTAYVDRLKSGYKSETAYNSAVRKALRENDPRIKEAAVARYNGDIAEYTRIAKKIIAEKHFKQDDIVAAINSEINALKKGEETTTSSSNKAASIYNVDDYYASIIGGNTVIVDTIFQELVREKVAEGYLQVEAEDSIASSFSAKVKEAYMDGDIARTKAVSLLISHGNKSNSEAEVEVKKVDFELKHNISWGERARAYRLGKISESALVSAVMDIEGETREGAEEYIRFLDLEIDNPNLDISASDAAKYFEYAEPANIGIEVYLDYKEQTKGLASDKDANGKSISGSKKSKIMAVINSLPISSYQKDALYYSNGWSASTLWEAPWH